MSNLKIETGALLMPAMKIPLLGVEPGDVLTLTIDGKHVISGHHRWLIDTLIEEINNGLWWYHSASGVSRISQKKYTSIITIVETLATRIERELKKLIGIASIESAAEPVDAPQKEADLDSMAPVDFTPKEANITPKKFNNHFQEMQANRSIQ